MPWKEPSKGREHKKNKWKNDPEYRERKLEYNREWRKKPGRQEEINQKSRERYKQKKNEMVELLGGKCVGCGTTHNLEFDHIDRTQKEYNVTKFLKGTRCNLVEEINKCQLLCKSCHIIKSRIHYDQEQMLKGYSLQSITQENGRITIVYETS